MLRWSTLVIAGFLLLGQGAESKTGNQELIDQILLRLETLEKDNGDLKYDISNLKTKVNQLESGNPSDNKHNGTGFYGFLAQPQTDVIYYRYDTLQFPIVIYNYGNNYQPSTSTYICPVSGYYWFSVTLLSDTGLTYGKIYGTITLGNSAYLLRATAKSTGDNNQGQNSGIVYCFQGQIVEIIAETTNTNGLGLLASNESSFTGFLIWAGAQ